MSQKFANHPSGCSRRLVDARPYVAARKSVPPSERLANFPNVNTSRRSEEKASKFIDAPERSERSERLCRVCGDGGKHTCVSTYRTRGGNNVRNVRTFGNRDAVGNPYLANRSPLKGIEVMKYTIKSHPTLYARTVAPCRHR